MVDSAIAAMTDRMRAGASNTHGAFPLSEEIDAVIADARRAGADFLGCDPGEVVFGQNATSLLLHLSRSLGRTWGSGDEIVVTRLDHDANVRPWMLAARDAGATIRWVDVREDDVTLDLDSFDAQLSERTKLVAFTLASNAVGTMPPAAELTARAKAVGALVAVDGVHLSQHHAVDLHGIGADIVATSPYKYFGPHQGMLGVRAELLARLEPYKLRAAVRRRPRPLGDGHAEPRIAGRHGRGDRLHRRDGWRRRRSACGDRRRLRRVRCARARTRAAVPRGRRPVARRSGCYGIADLDRLGERTPTFAVRVGDQHPLETCAALAERGIFTWDGHYYAIEVFDRLGLLETGGAVRIGFCHYHTLEEVDRVLEALGELAA